MTDGSAPTPPVTPPMPGVASVPATPPPAGPPPDAGPTSFDPSMAGPPANDVSGMGGAPMPPSPLPLPLPQVQQPPNVPPTGAGPATGTDGTALSGMAASTAQPGGDQHAQITSSITDANNTIKAIASAIKQANPNIDPETLFEATSQHINQMKGVRNEVKDYMDAQVKLAAQQNAVLRAGMNIQGRQGVADTRAGSVVDKANIDAQSRETTGAGHDAARVTASQNQAGARVTAAQIAAQGGVTRAQIASDTQRFVQDAHDKTRVYDTQLQAWTKVANANTGADARVDAETARAGGTPPARQRLNPLPMPAAPGGAPSGNTQYKSLAALQSAFKAGQVDAVTAQRIAKANGWAR